MFSFRTPFLMPIKVLKSDMLIDTSVLDHLYKAPLSSCSQGEYGLPGVGVREEGIVWLCKTGKFQSLFPWIQVQGNGTEYWHYLPQVLPQNTSEKNKLVELYQYPGYDEHEPTPLPNGTELAEVIEKVVCAQRKSASGKVLCILTKSSKCVLVCLYLHMSGYAMHMYPNREIQGQLFDRIAKNYAALLFDCHRFRYQNALIKVSSYSNWDYSHLEPERFRREDLLSTKGKQRKGKSTDEIAFPTCSC
uniref:Family with sequence similarity 227 member A n=1 Tax=Gopherus evgoodei TaxID=1825980 RepID=A0A8C4VGK9_9SAUR